MTDDQIMEPAAFLDLWVEKHFLGQEFLTWLWIVSEINGNLLNLKPLAPQSSLMTPPNAVELWFESRLTLESGQGQDRKTVTCQDPSGQWAEAHTALRRGKKITRARLKIVTDEKEWSLSLDASTLTPQGVKFPKTFTEGEEEDDSQTGKLLERLALMGELTSIVAALFYEFLQIRLSPQWDSQELPRLNKWLEQK